MRKSAEKNNLKNTVEEFEREQYVDASGSRHNKNKNNNTEEFEREQYVDASGSRHNNKN